jgi:hypothetical protein
MVRALCDKAVVQLGYSGPLQSMKQCDGGSFAVDKMALWERAREKYLSNGGH